MHCNCHHRTDKNSTSFTAINSTCIRTTAELCLWTRGGAVSDAAVGSTCPCRVPRAAFPAPPCPGVWMSTVDRAPTVCPSGSPLLCKHCHYGKSRGQLPFYGIFYRQLMWRLISFLYVWSFSDASVQLSRRVAVDLSAIPQKTSALTLTRVQYSKCAYGPCC